jgi:hypothetical protein
MHERSGRTGYALLSKKGDFTFHLLQRSSKLTVFTCMSEVGRTGHALLSKQYYQELLNFEYFLTSIVNTTS